MTSKIVKYHATDGGIALLFSPDKGEYWIGQYHSYMTHQTPEPPYVWISGNWTSLAEAEISLALWI